MVVISLPIPPVGGLVFHSQYQILQHVNTVVDSKVQEDDSLLNDLTVHPEEGTMQIPV